MFKRYRFSFLTLSLVLLTQTLRADGFRLSWALENYGAVALSLTPAQIEQVGSERKLVLTDAQKTQLRKKSKHVPDVLGVESLGEPDCSCHISSAMWTDTGKVTVWTKRLAYDQDGSRWYHEVRTTPGHYSMDATGRIFHAGQPVSWDGFRMSVRWRIWTKKPRHLALPPTVPPAIQKKLDALPEDERCWGRM